MHEQDFSFKYLLKFLFTSIEARIIAIIGIAVFFNSLFNNFLMDDLPYIVLNPDMQGINIPQLFGGNIFNTSAYYRPIPAVYFALLHNIFGNQAFFYHLIQVSLHIVNACLVFILFKRFIGKTVSLFLALVFLIHPIQVESVAYIGASQSELFFLFGIIALLISTRHHLQGKHWLLIAIFSLFSLLTKETGFLFVLMILLFQAIFNKKRFLKFLALESIALVVYLFIRFFIGGTFLSKVDFAPIAQLTLGERLLSIPQIFFYYIKTVVYPVRLAVEQHWTVIKITEKNFYLPLFFDFLVLFFICAAGVFIYGRNRDHFKSYFLFFAWFIVGVAMIMQIFPLDMTVADRWFYFPLVGLLGMIGISVKLLRLQKKLYKTLAVFLVCILLLLFSLRTMVRNTNWYSGSTLYAHDIQLEEADNFVNHNNYAITLSNEGNLALALKHAERSVTLYPFEKNLVNLGWLYFQVGQREKGMKYMYKGLQAKSFPSQRNPHLHDEDTYELIARLQYIYGDAKDSALIAREGVKDYSGSARLWLLLALSEYKNQNHKQAVAAIDKAYALSPNDQIGAVRVKIINNLPVVVTIEK